MREFLYNIYTLCVYTAVNLSYLDERIDALTEKCISELQTQGFKQ